MAFKATTAEGCWLQRRVGRSQTRRRVAGLLATAWSLLSLGTAGASISDLIVTVEVLQVRPAEETKISLRNVGDARLVDVNVVALISEEVIATARWAELQVGESVAISPKLSASGGNVRAGQYPLIVQARWFDEEMRAFSTVEAVPVRVGSSTVRRPSVEIVALDSSEQPSVRLRNSAGAPVDVRSIVVVGAHVGASAARRLRIPAASETVGSFVVARPRRIVEGGTRAFVIVEWEDDGQHGTDISGTELPWLQYRGDSGRELTICMAVLVALFAAVCWVDCVAWQRGAT